VSSSPSSGLEVVETLLAQVLAHPGAGRGDALDRACLEHPEHAVPLRELFELVRGLDLPDPGGPSLPDRIGDFEIVERIGAGGMGVVYLASQPSLGRKVALKLIRSEFLHSSSARERFRREARTMARLRHPSIVPVHAVGEHEGAPFFAMAWIEGRSLDAVMEQRRAGSLPEAGDPLTRDAWWRTVTRLGIELARGLEHAHERGVLHRDLKPSNVMVTREGHAVLLDFGLAQTQDDEPRLTRSGSQPGSLPYMAPEQVRGEGTAVSAATDVYGLGATLFEALTLRPPFAAATRAQLEQEIATAPAPSIRALAPEVPRDLAAVVDVCLRKRPSSRHGSAAELRAELECVLAGRPVRSRSLSPIRRLACTAWRRRLRALLAVTIPLLGLAGVGLLTLWPEASLARGIREQQALASRLDAGFELLAAQRWNDAETHFSVLVAEAPGEEALAGWALATLRRERFGPCLEVLDRHAASVEASVGLRWLRAACRRNTGDLARAEAEERSLPRPSNPLSIYLYVAGRMPAICDGDWAPRVDCLQWLRRCTTLGGGDRPLYLVELAHVLSHDPSDRTTEERTRLAHLLLARWTGLSPRVAFYAADLLPHGSREQVEALELVSDRHHGAAIALLRLRQASGDVDGARAVVERFAAVRGPRAPGSIRLRAALHWEKGDRTTALAVLEAELGLVRSLQILWCQYTDYLAGAGRLNEAVDEARAMARAMDSAAVDATLARTLSRAGLVAEALPVFARAVERQPTSGRALVDYAAALTASDDPSAALHIYRRAATVADHPDAHRFLGSRSLRLRTFAAGARHFAAAWAQQPHDWTHPRWLALCLIEDDRADEAETILERAAERFPDNLRIGLLRLEAAAALGRHAEAIQGVRELGDRVEVDHRLCVQAARVLRKAGRPEEGETILRAALTRWPAAHLAQAELGVALSTQGRHAEARSAFEAALALAPSSPGYLGRLGLACARLGEPNQAIVSLSSAALAGLADPEFLRELATLLTARGRGQAAAAVYRGLIERGDDSPRLRLDYGRLLGQSGDHAAATIQFGAARDGSSPGSALRAEALAALEGR
jgi:serine/threonine protein kinase/tetratricopeptide (TPR) repeat protein